MSGLLVILKACRYGEILFGVGVFVMFPVLHMSLCIMVNTPPRGGPLWRICQWLSWFLLFYKILSMFCDGFVAR